MTATLVVMSTSKRSFKTTYYLRNGRANDKGSPIMMRITLNGDQLNFSINHRVPEKFWNSKLSKASKGYCTSSKKLDIIDWSNLQKNC